MSWRRFGVIVGLLALPSSLRAQTCGVVGENKAVKLACDGNTKFLPSSTVVFGTPTGDCDSHNIQRGDCNADEVMSVFKTCCVGISRCVPVLRMPPRPKRSAALST